MTWSTSRRALAFVALLAAPACGGGSGALFVGTVSRSQFFEYHDEVDEPLCPTLLSMLDQHIQLIGGKIGLTPDPANPIAYYKFRDAAELEANATCPETAGCAGVDAVYSSLYFHAHELAHTYVFRAWGGHPVGLVTEGEAVALSCDPGYIVQPGYLPRDVLGNPDWRDQLYLFGNSREGYQAAGYWITYLAQHYGWDSVRELHHRAPPGIAAADFEREFARVYPISMDEAWAAALGTPGAPPCEDDWRCMATPLAPGDRVPPACDGEMHRSITIGDQPGIALTIGGVDSEIVLRDCNDPEPALYPLLAGGTDRTAFFVGLPAGTYTLFGSATDVALPTYLPSSFDGDSCAVDGGVTLDPAQWTYVDLPPGRTNGWIPIAGGGQSYLAEPYNLLWNGWPSTAGAPEICDGCDPTATCVTLAPFGQTAVTIGDSAVLRVVGASASQSSSIFGQIILVPASSMGQGP